MADWLRIDALPSSRHVCVLIDGEVVAESTHPTILLETGLAFDAAVASLTSGV